MITKSQPVIGSWRSWAPPAAGLWSGAALLVGAGWATGLAMSPLGIGDPRSGQVGSLLEGLRSAQVGWIAIAIAVVGLATALLIRLLPHRRWPAIPALYLSVVLLVLVPDVRVIQNFLYLFFGYFGLWDGGQATMIVSIAGGLLWLLVGLRQLTLDRDLRTLIAPPRWTVPVTYLAAALALPYPIVRSAWGLGIPLGVPDGYLDVFLWWQRLGLIVFFGGLPIAGAVLTIGLVRPWGQAFPRWMPWLGGRRVPTLVAVGPGCLAAVLIIQMGLRVSPIAARRLGAITPTSWGADLPGLFVLPWGLAVAAAVYAYAAGRLHRPAND